MEMYIFLFITAVVFTAVGYYQAGKNLTRKSIETTIASTIDTLIKDNYIKTKGKGNDLVILKWTEWNDTETDQSQSS